MIYYPNKYFLLAEDNHIKLCSLVPDTKNIIIHLANILPIYHLKRLTDELILAASEDGTILVIDIVKYRAKSIYLSPHRQGVVSIELGTHNELYSIGLDGKIIKIDAEKEYKII